MPHDPNFALMQQTFPDAADKLAAAIQDVQAKVLSHDPLLHRSEGYVQIALVEPMLDALGFDANHRRMEFIPFEHCILYAIGEQMVLLLIKVLGHPSAGAQWAETALEAIGFNGRIVVTDGLNWHTYHPGESPDLHHDVGQPGAFWDLLTIGQTNVAR